jgi:hypothetical protein
MVATGHTYDRASIQRWLNAGHKTCPVTGSRLRHLELTPNHALRSAIQVQCCAIVMCLARKVLFGHARNTIGRVAVAVAFVLFSLRAFAASCQYMVDGPSVAVLLLWCRSGAWRTESCSRPQALQLPLQRHWRGRLRLHLQLFSHLLAKGLKAAPTKGVLLLSNRWHLRQ